MSAAMRDSVSVGAGLGAQMCIKKVTQLAIVTFVMRSHNMYTDAPLALNYFPQPLQRDAYVHNGYIRRSRPHAVAPFTAGQTAPINHQYFAGHPQGYVFEAAFLTAITTDEV